MPTPRENPIIDPDWEQEDLEWDQCLRPQSLNQYIGQKKIKNNLSIFIQAALERKEPTEHVLLYGAPGLGKTTLAHIIAKEMNANIRVTSGPAIEKNGDLAAILTNLEYGEILFIDEIHRLNKSIEEILYPAMEDYVLDIIIGKGPTAKTLRIDLPKFTIIGATTKISLLSSPLRDRFGNILHLNFYNQQELRKIIERNARIFKIPILENAAELIAKRSRGTPRVANRLLKRVRDLAQIQKKQQIDTHVTRETMELLEIDSLGLDHVDRLIMRTLIEKFKRGPVGLKTLAAATGEEIRTIEEVYEPYLMQIGFVNRTPRGREVTDIGYEHLTKK